MKEFYTTEKAEEGITVPLHTPDGKPSEHSLTVLGVDSKTWRVKESKARATAVLIGEIEDEDKRHEAFVDHRLRSIAELVTDWTFEEPCTLDNVFSFLSNAPQIADAVDKVAYNRRLLFTKK